MTTPSVWDHFSIEELECRHCGEMHMDNVFMSQLVIIRKDLDIPLHINSAYRCPEYNDKISGSGRNGAHTTGKAVDISTLTLPESAQIDLILLAGKHYPNLGLGVNERGARSGRFIHIDNVKKRLWSY